MLVNSLLVALALGLDVENPNVRQALGLHVKQKVQNPEDEHEVEERWDGLS